MKIKQMLFLVLVASSIIPLAIFSYVGVQAYNNKIENLLEANMTNMATFQVRAVEAFFTKIDHTLGGISNSKTVAALLVAANRDANREMQRLYPFVDDVLATEKADNPVIESITLLDKNFRIIGCNIPVDKGEISKIKQVNYSLPADKTLFTSVVAAPNSSGNKAVIAGIRPIYEAGAVQGYIIAELNLSYFDKLRQEIQIMETGVIYLIDAKGQAVTAGNQEMTPTEYENRLIDTKDFFKQWEAENANLNESGLVKYKSAGTQYLTYYAKLAEPAWRVFVSVDLDFITAKETQIIHKIILFIGISCICLLFIGHYVVVKWLAKPVDRLILQVMQIKENKNLGLRIRRMPKNEVGKIAESFNELLDDIERNTNELRLSQTKYNMVMDQTNNIFIERDYESKSWFVSRRFEEIFGYQFPFKNLKKNIDFLHYIYPNDQKKYWQWTLKSYRALENMQIEMRIRTIDDQFIWVRLVLMPMFNQQGRVIKSIGLMTDINKEKQESERLKLEARQDPLTGLLNKGALEIQIRQIIAQKTACALLFIDIDDFKNFNTQYGHLYGDEVLKLLAGILRDNIVGIIGRNGGDEFVACITDPAAIEQVENIAKQILVATGTGIADQANASTIKLHCSIGIACYPQVANSYEELLHQADAAMYIVKESGKSNYCIKR